MPGLLETLAPLLGTAIAGPFGGIAASFIADKLGVPDKTVQAVTDALSTDKMTPDQVAQIKMAEIDFKKWMGDNALKVEQLGYDDKKSARDMEIATKSYTPSVLAGVVVGGFALITALKVAGAPIAADPTIQDLLTTLRDGVILVLSFYFGSSAGSQKKDSLLAQSQPVK